MEKVNYDLKFYAYFIILFSPISYFLMLYLVQSKEPFFLTIIFSICLFFVFGFIERSNEQGLFISHEGFYLKIKKQEINDTIPWNNLIIKKQSKHWLFKELRFQFGNMLNDQSFSLNIFNYHSFSVLIKKYCPKEHEVYKLTREYANEKNLPF